MENIELICPCCKHKFAEKYYTGGYIDHMNFLGYFDEATKNGQDIDVDNLVKETCYNNYAFRSDDDIADRISCVRLALSRNRKYDKKLQVYFDNVGKELDKADIVKKEVEALQEKYKNADRVILMNIAKHLCD